MKTLFQRGAFPCASTTARCAIHFLVCLALSNAVAADLGTTNHPLSVSQRLEPVHLQATHLARKGFVEQRRPVLDHGLYEDLPAIIRTRAEGSDDTKPARADFLAAVKKNGIKVVMETPPQGAKLDDWRGLHETVLYIAGAKDVNGTLWFPDFGANGNAIPNSGLRFLSQSDEHPEASTGGMAGMDIGSGHNHANKDQGLKAHLAAASRQNTQWKTLVENFRTYPDEFFAAGSDDNPEILARWDKETRMKNFTGIASTDARQNLVFKGVTFDPFEVSIRNLVTHIMARGQTEPLVREALANGHVYISHDWLCDPAGFSFGAVNNLGVFNMGDDAPLVGKTRVMANTPVPARLRLYLNGEIVSETSGTNLTYDAQTVGSCRLEAWLNVDGEDRPWIYSNPIYLRAARPNELRLPGMEISAEVEPHKDISYEEGPEDQAGKNKLDLYVPKGKTSTPVLFFIHGGAWKTGDRSYYPPLGNRYARAGILTVIPSYRLAPKYPHPAQIEDVAAAFAWTVRHAAEYGGDTNRIFVAGHSAGGHLAALLALDPTYLERYKVSPGHIRGVMAWSGVYNLTLTEGLESVFTNNPEVRRQASPFHHVKAGAPRFLVSFCQHDYFSLPAQAHQFHRALQRAGVDSELLYIPEENHLSEMTHVANPDDPLVAAALRFMK